MILAGDVLVDVELDFGTFLGLADVAALQDVDLWIYFLFFLLTALIPLRNRDKYFARGAIGQTIPLLM